MGLLKSLAPYKGDWVFCNLPGLYLHEGRVYLTGTIGTNIGLAPAGLKAGEKMPTGSTILTGLPPELRPAVDTKIMLLMDYDETEPWLQKEQPTTVKTDGTWTFDAEANTSPRWEEEGPTSRKNEEAVYILANVSWATAAARTDSIPAGESLAPYLFPAGRWEDIDGRIALHGSRVHLSGHVRCINSNVNAVLELPAKYAPAIPSTTDPGAAFGYTQAHGPWGPMGLYLRFPRVELTAGPFEPYTFFAEYYPVAEEGASELEHGAVAPQDAGLVAVSGSRLSVTGTQIFADVDLTPLTPEERGTLDEHCVSFYIAVVPPGHESGSYYRFDILTELIEDEEGKAWVTSVRIVAVDTSGAEREIGSTPALTRTPVEFAEAAPISFNFHCEASSTPFPGKAEGPPGSVYLEVSGIGIGYYFVDGTAEAEGLAAVGLVGVRSAVPGGTVTRAWVQEIPNVIQPSIAAGDVIDFTDTGWPGAIALSELVAGPPVAGMIQKTRAISGRTGMPVTVP